MKLYNEKPSRIGVKFPFEYQAQKAYEALVSAHRGETFQVKLELVQDKLLLTLLSDETGKKIQYKELDFKSQQIILLKNYVDQLSTFIFVHVYPKHGNLFVAKPFRKEEFVKISKLGVFSAMYG